MSDMEKHEERERFRELLKELSDPNGVARLPWAMTPDEDMLMDDSGDHLTGIVMRPMPIHGIEAEVEEPHAYFEPPIAEFLLLAVRIATEAVK